MNANSEYLSFYGWRGGSIGGRAKKLKGKDAENKDVIYVTLSVKE